MRYSNKIQDYFARFLHNQKALAKCLALLCLFLALLLCWRIGVVHENEDAYRYIEIPMTDTTFDETFSYLSVTQLDRKTTPENARQIVLDDYEHEILIDEGGDYMLSGSMDGHILISAKDEKVHLFLNNISIVSEGGPAILLPEDSGDKLTITLMPGTDNIVSDNGDYRDYSDYKAAIEATCDITINGSGSLTVNGYYKDAIHSKDIVRILNGSYAIKCKRNGISGNDGIVVCDGKIKISSEKNGFKTENEGDNGRGNLIISGGEHTIIAGNYSFVASRAAVIIYNCTIQNRSIAGVYDCGRMERIQEGCVQ